MFPDSIFFANNLKDWIDLVNGILMILVGAGLVGLVLLFFTKFIPWYRTKKDNRSLEIQHLRLDHFTLTQP